MLAALSLAILIGAVPNKTDPEVRGRLLFHYAGLGKNGVACADCHATVEDEERDGDGLIRAGHTLWGVAHRPSWRGDTRRSAHPNLKEALDICVQLFQGGTPLEPEEGRLLVAYLESISPKKPQAALQIQPALEANLDYRRERYQGGDAERGKRLFFRACNGCHPRAGQGLGSALSGLQPADVARAAREGNGLLRGARQPGAWMPFFGRDRLNDAQVADISAYLASFPREAPPEEPKRAATDGKASH